ncbi:hypothetical protein ACNS7O_05175 [Haloferacaceae archaeon DSL9]
MHRFIRYLLGLAVACAVTVAVSTREQSPRLLAAIFVIYASGVAITLKYPALLWNENRSEKPNGFPAGVLAGGTSFGAPMLAMGTGSLGAGVLGFGLVAFGVAVGVWLVDAGTIPLASEGS